MNLVEIKKYIPIAESYYSALEKYYKDLLDKKGFEEVVKQASEAKVPKNDIDKTTFSVHKYRIGLEKCQKSSVELLKSSNIKDLENAKSFEDIFVVTERVKISIYGIGDLWSYDTAQRIALSRGYYPLEVYLQQGSKNGLKLLIKSGLLKSSKIKGKRKIDKNLLPIELSNSPSFIIENILCVGKRNNWF